MASLRKKYQSLETEASPVTTTPTAGANLPPATDNPPDIEQAAPPVESNKVEEAAQSAIKQRLEEMKSAAEMQAPQQQPQQPVADDPEQEEQLQQLRARIEQAVSGLPTEEARHWFRMRPEYLLNPEKNAEVQHFNNVAIRETGEQFSPKYFERLETHLGIRQPEPEPSRPPQSQRQAPTPQRPSGPAVNVSAPPTREAPSMSTGRPAGDSRITLSNEEVNCARMWGLSTEEYARQKLRLKREKEAGMHDHG